jgi:hypothetical protein
MEAEGHVELLQALIALQPPIPPAAVVLPEDQQAQSGLDETSAAAPPPPTPPLHPQRAMVLWVTRWSSV